MMRFVSSKNGKKPRFAVMCVCLALTMCAAPAFGGWTDSITEGLSAGWNKITGLFGSDDPTEKPDAPNNGSGDVFPDYLAESWDKLSNSLFGALELRDESEKLPDSAWFGNDKASNAKKINKLLDIALEILSQGKAGEIRRDAAALRERQSSLRAEADKLRNKRISAPESSIIPWRETRAKLNERLAELERETAENDAALAAVNAELSNELRGMGLELDQAQIDVLLSSVTGDDLLQNTVVFTNVKAVVEKLESLAKKDTDDLEISRRYTGMYLVLNDLLIYTQEGLVKKIDDVYKPRLGEIIREADEIRRDALNKSRKNTYTEAQKQSFERNAESNAMTAKVARLYSELLDTQKKGLLDNLRELRLNRDVAESTYRTVRSSGDLRNLIHTGLSLFDSITALSMPKLQPFESEAMRREFEEINKRLKK